jgi:hypothetical protein
VETTTLRGHDGIRPLSSLHSSLGLEGPLPTSGLESAGSNRRGYRTDAGDGGESLAGFVLCRGLLDNCVHLFDACGELIEFQLELSQ